MPELRLYLFGTPRLELSGKPIRIERRKALALAAYLALSRQAQSRDVLATLLWPESDHDQARAALRSTLSTLMKTSTPPWIEADRTTIRVSPDMIWVDVVAFRNEIKEASSHSHGDDILCNHCLEAYTTASQLYVADLLHGFYLSDSPDFEDWQMQQREWLRREYVEIQRRLTLHHFKDQRFDLALVHAQHWLDSDPLNERTHQMLMRIFATNGQRSEVQRQYQRCVELLDEAFASLPDYETTQLYETLVQSAVPSAQRIDTSTQVVGVIPPLPGLVIGRMQSLTEIKSRLGIGTDAARPLTLIHGWPGVGKSTVAAMLTHDPDITKQFPDGILWASLGETPDLLGEISSWVDALGLHDASQTHRIEELSIRLSAAIRDKRMLLVIDDVWQVDHVRPFRIGGQHCVTVMTSRLFDVALSLAPSAADIYRLPLLSEVASLDLLARLTPETVTHFPDESRELIKDLEGLPLAIHVAGRLLHAESSMGWGIRELLDELHVGARLLEAQPPTDVLMIGRDASPTVAALLSRSTNRLDPEMRLRFAMLGFFVPKPASFDLEAMSVAWGIDDPRSTVRHLVNYGLLEPVSGGRFQMHALLVMHAKAMLQTEFGG